jgi:hypothetical protein
MVRFSPFHYLCIAYFLPVPATKNHPGTQVNRTIENISPAAIVYQNGEQKVKKINNLADFCPET